MNERRNHSTGRRADDQGITERLTCILSSILTDSQREKICDYWVTATAIILPLYILWYAFDYAANH